MPFLNFKLVQVSLNITQNNEQEPIFDQNVLAFYQKAGADIKEKSKKSAYWDSESRNNCFQQEVIKKAAENNATIDFKLKFEMDKRLENSKKQFFIDEEIASFYEDVIKIIKASTLHGNRSEYLNDNFRKNELRKLLREKFQESQKKCDRLIEHAEDKYRAILNFYSI